MTNARRTDAVSRLIEVGLDQEAARRGVSEGEAGHHIPATDRQGGTMDTLTQLGQLGPLLAGVVGGISPDQLDRPTPCSQFTVRGVLEHMIAGAMATATGQCYNPPDELVAAADAFARQTIDPLRDGDAFAEAVEPDAGASPIEKLAAYTGRRPVAPGAAMTGTLHPGDLVATRR